MIECSIFGQRLRTRLDLSMLRCILSDLGMPRLIIVRDMASARIASPVLLVKFRNRQEYSGLCTALRRALSSSQGLCFTSKSIFRRISTAPKAYSLRLSLISNGICYVSEYSWRFHFREFLYSTISRASLARPWSNGGFPRPLGPPCTSSPRALASITKSEVKLFFST